MPDLTLPNGTVITNAPPGMSVEQVLSLVKAVNPQGFRSLMSQPGVGPALEPSQLERFGRGMSDPVLGARQLLPEALGGFNPQQEQQAQADAALFERGAGPGFDPARVLGQAATMAPAALATAPAAGAAGLGMLGRLGAGAAVGGAEGATLFARSPEERLGQALGGAVGGGALNAVGPPLARAAGKTLGAGKALAQRALQPGGIAARVTAELEAAAAAAGMSLDDLGAPGLEALRRKAATSLARTGSSNAEELLRVARAERFGFVDDAALTAGQQTRNPRQFSDEAELAKLDIVGDVVEDRFTNQRAQVESKLRELSERVSGGIDDAQPFAAGEVVESAARRVSNELQEGVRAAYKAAEDARPDVELSGDFFMRKVGPILKDFEDAVPAGVKTRIRELTRGFDEEGGRVFSPSEAAKLDRLINDTLPSDPFAKTQRLAARRLQEALADTMEEAGDRAGEFAGLYKAAKDVAKARFRAIGDPKQLTAKLVSESFDPEKVTATVMGGSVRQVGNLMRFLADQPQAIMQIRASVISEIMDKARPSGEFSQAAYNRAIKRVGEKRLTLIFGEASVARELIDFGRVARDLFAAPAGNRINRSNTTSAAANLIGTMASAVPGGSVVMGLRSAGQKAALDRARSQAAASAVGQQTPPIPNLLQAADPLIRGAAPTVGGLLGAQRGRQ